MLVGSRGSVEHVALGGNSMALYMYFAVAMSVQMVAGRTQLLATRGGISDFGGLFSALIGIVSGLSFFAIAIWGFAWLHWYVVVPTILVMGFISGFVVNLRTFAFWYQTRSLVDVVAVAMTSFLWIKYWPF